MQRPTWVTVVAVLGIIFGCFGILGGGQELMMPKILAFQKNMFSSIQRDMVDKQNQKQSGAPGETTAANQDNHRNLPPPEFTQAMETMFDVPPWFATWSIFSGSAKAIISAFYLFAAILMLQLKPNSIRLFYWAAGANIALLIVKACVAVLGSGFMMMMMSVGGVFGAMIDVVLIIVVATGDKTAFAPVNKGESGVSGDADGNST